MRSTVHQYLYDQRFMLNYKHLFQDEETIIQNFIFICIAKEDSIIWLAVSYSYKAILQILAIFTAFTTRRVKIKALNDSKEIAAIIYINSVVLVLLGVIQLLLSKFHTVYTTMIGLGLWIEGTLFLGLLFVPKVCCIHITHIDWLYL